MDILLASTFCYYEQYYYELYVYTFGWIYVFISSGSLKGTVFFFLFEDNSSDSTVYHVMTQVVKNLPAMQETWVQSLSQEDPMEKGMATHSNTPA